MVILDTNIIIDHLRQVGAEDSWFIKVAKLLPKESLGISMITIQELYEGRSTKFQKKETEMLAIVSPLKIYPYTYEVAQKAGELARDLSFPVELADAAIAATCMVNNCQLFTLNIKHFREIKDLQLFSLT